jgi:hypothetical protein
MEPPESVVRPQFERVLTIMLEMEDRLVADREMSRVDREQLLAYLRRRIAEHVALFDEYYPQ